MSVLKCVLLGVFQGITEFLPISSSGHISALQNLFPSSDSEIALAFTVMLHLGTLFSVWAVYHREIKELFCGGFTLLSRFFGKNKNTAFGYGEKLFILLFLASVPLCAALALKSLAEAIAGNNILIGSLLLFNGVLLFASDKASREKYSLNNIPVRYGVFIGVFQLIGIFPGVSRSGSSIVGCRAAGLNKSDAVKFAFLMSLPAVLGANISELFSLGTAIPKSDILPMICGILAAFFAGIASIKLLNYISKSKKMSVFAVYSLIVGAAVILTGILL